MSMTKKVLEELVASLRDDLTHAERHVSELGTWKDTVPVGFEAYAAAMLLHHLYGAIESFVERSLKTFDGRIEEGEGSHIQLLEQASKEAKGVRGVILPRNATVDELRRFRHRFRKRYDVDLDPTLIHPVVRKALAAWPEIRGHLESFAAFVDECIKVAQ